MQNAENSTSNLLLFDESNNVPHTEGVDNSHTILQGLAAKLQSKSFNLTPFEHQFVLPKKLNKQHSNSVFDLNLTPQDVDQVDTNKKIVILLCLYY